MANTGVIQSQTYRDVTFYAFGRPCRTLPDSFKKISFDIVRRNFSNLIPTTYEASRAYLDQELLKPEGQRDLRSEMCMLTVTKIPGDQDILMRCDATKLLVPLTEGATLFCPTIELPPDSFGTPENPLSNILLDQKTNTRGRATILLAYFTSAGEKLEYSGGTKNATQLGFS